MAQYQRMKGEKDQKWLPAIYARLSDDDGRAGVSQSIETQIEMLEDFVKNKGWESPKVFYDDDKTGTNFNRKGFQDMYAEAQAGKINVIIINDTSRFGRNWVKSGDYFEKIEEMGVRFISLREGIDTIDPKCPALKMIPFYFVFAEWHSQTTSEKLRAVFESKAKKGEYNTVVPPYGYNKDINDKHHLVIDEDSAGVVRKIYSLRLAKYSLGAIVNILNAEGIPSPTTRHLENGDTSWALGDSGRWTRTYVAKMFENPVYRGDTANGKHTTVSYKNHSPIVRPFSDWIIVENTHEAIVSRDDWQTCFDMIDNAKRVRRTKRGEIHPLAGLVVCPDCGRSFNYNVTYYKAKSGKVKEKGHYNCGTYACHGKAACQSHHVSAERLTEIVIKDIKEKVQKITVDDEALRRRYCERKTNCKKMLISDSGKVLKKLNKRIAELDRFIQGAFEEKILGKISVDICNGLIEKYGTEKNELTDRATNIKKMSATENEAEKEIDAFIRLMK